jgi:hypothetical protein
MQFGQLFYSTITPLKHPDDGSKNDRNMWVNCNILYSIFFGVHLLFYHLSVNEISTLFPLKISVRHIVFFFECTYSRSFARHMSRSSNRCPLKVNKQQLYIVKPSNTTLVDINT